MATTSPARIEDDLYASAKLAGDALSRSASQQIAHWARIGREIQASASISHREIADVLAGRHSYDGLDPKEQAIVRAEWAERMAVYRETLDLTTRFAAEGRSWVELDDDGRVVERDHAVVKPARPPLKRAAAAKKSAKAVAAKRAAAPRRSTRTRASVMPDPVLHVLAGPNGAGKSTLYELVVGPATHLEFVNADEIAAARWPDDPSGRSYDAAAVAADRRIELLGQHRSFVTETVFSHVSKVELLRAATNAGYLVTLHVVMVPEELAVARVTSRVAAGGHAVPEQKIRERYQRLWPLVAEAIRIVDTAVVYDNSRAKMPFRVVATFERGSLVNAADWPGWTPPILRA